jgi:hypothetical protein
LKDETIDRTLWRTRFGRCYEPVLRKDYRMNKCNKLQISRKMLMKICNIKFQGNPSSVSRNDVSGLADSKTDMAKIISFYREYVNRPNSKRVGPTLVGPRSRAYQMVSS